MAKVTVVFDEGGDWEALYVDGILVDETHSLSIQRVLDTLVGKTVDDVEYFEFDFEHSNAGRGFETLEKYSDLKPW